VQGDVKSNFQQNKVIRVAEIKWMVGLEISALFIGRMESQQSSHGRLF
jgi:hypothetical protein